MITTRPTELASENPPAETATARLIQGVNTSR